MQIADIPPDIISIIEVIPKAQINPFDKEDYIFPGLMYS